MDANAIALGGRFGVYDTVSAVAGVGKVSAYFLPSTYFIGLFA